MKTIYTRPYQKPGLLRRLFRFIDWGYAGEVYGGALFGLFWIAYLCLIFAALEMVTR